MAVVGAGQNIPGGGEEMGVGINDKIGDRAGRGFVQGDKQGRGRRGGVSGSEQVKWSRVERSGAEWSGVER